MSKCKECKTELIKAVKGMKCPNWFNCSKYDIETNESIIAELEAENTQLKAALTNIQAITDNNYDHDMLRIAKLAKGAMENRG